MKKLRSILTIILSGLVLTGCNINGYKLGLPFEITHPFADSLNETYETEVVEETEETIDLDKYKTIYGTEAIGYIDFSDNWLMVPTEIGLKYKKTFGVSDVYVSLYDTHDTIDEYVETLLHTDGIELLAEIEYNKTSENVVNPNFIWEVITYCNRNTYTVFNCSTVLFTNRDNNNRSKILKIDYSIPNDVVKTTIHKYEFLKVYDEITASYSETNIIKDYYLTSDQNDEFSVIFEKDLGIPLYNNDDEYLTDIYCTEYCNLDLCSTNKEIHIYHVLNNEINYTIKNYTEQYNIDLINNTYEEENYIDDVYKKMKGTIVDQFELETGVVYINQWKLTGTDDFEYLDYDIVFYKDDNHTAQFTLPGDLIDELTVQNIARQVFLNTSAISEDTTEENIEENSQ